MPDHRLALTLEPGTMKTAEIAGREVLVARVGDTYYAVEPTCSHYGAPLVDGALVGDRLVCPWHHACFHLTTGRQLEPPGRDDLAAFPVRQDGGELVITLPDEEISHPMPPMTTAHHEEDTRTVAIVGAGAAGLHAAQELRVQGFEGRIFLFGAAAHEPQDRTMLSKSYLQSADEKDWLPLRHAPFFQEHRIALWLNRAVARFDADSRTLYFDDGSPFEADAVILATGATPRQLDVPGSTLDGVFTLRDTPDADAIRAYLDGRRNVVVVGSGFIGMEAAASLRQRGLSVTVVSRDAVPFARTLGQDVGRRVLGLHQSHGVRFVGEATVEALQGDGRVQGVRLSTGEIIDADAVVVGLGVTPATEFIEGVQRQDDGGIVVDERLRAAPGVYAAGDIAAFPLWMTGERVRIEHWRVAAQLGRVAARNALGQDAPYRGVPFFWTAHFDLNLRYVGHAGGWDEIIFDGNPADGPFIAYYVREGHVYAACGTGRDTEMAALHELMRREALPPLGALRSGSADLLARARALGVEA